MELLTVTQACRFIGVSRRTLYNWMNDGRLPYVRTVSGMRRVNKEDLFLKKDNHGTEKSFIDQEVGKRI